MAHTQAWRISEPGAAGGAVLAVDFTATGRSDAGFRTLMAQAGPGRALWETAAPPPGGEQGMTGLDYLDRWTDALVSAEVQVAAVLGYCASSTFAVALAERIGERQAAVPVVLFDPALVDGDIVLRDGFHTVVDALAAPLGAQEVERIRDDGRRALREHADLVDLNAELTRIYHDAVVAAFARLKLKPARAEELVAWFRGYLHYLVAAREVTGAPAPGTVTMIRSNEPGSGFPIEARKLDFDVEHVKLLADPGVGRAVADLLGANG